MPKNLEMEFFEFQILPLQILDKLISIYSLTISVMMRVIISSLDDMLKGVAGSNDMVYNFHKQILFKFSDILSQKC